LNDPFQDDVLKDTMRSSRAILATLAATLAIASTSAALSRSGSECSYASSAEGTTTNERSTKAPEKSGDGVARDGDLLSNRNELARPDELASHPAVKRCFHRLWKKSFHGLNATETAAWLVRKDGTLKCVEWPATHERTALTWKGRLPFDLVALVHTHPRITGSKPSFADHRAAEKLRKPVYTISWDGIWSVSPFTGEFTLVKGREWLERR
jgi:hypothetical protein